MRKFIIGFLASIGSLVLFSTIVIVILAKTSQSEKLTITPNTVLTIDFRGNMTENTQQRGLYSLVGKHYDSLFHMVNAIDQASKDPRVKGLIVRLDQASMGMAQAQELRNAIMRFRMLGRESNKFTIAHADTIGELGHGTTSYYLASAFDEIWLQPLGEVGITGIFLEMPFVKKLLDDLGVKIHVGKREEFKSMLDFATEESMGKPDREQLQALLNSIMNQVVRDIALSRELNETDVWDAVNKGPLFEQEALKLGLIDRVDYFDEIKTYLTTKVPDAKYMKVQDYLTSNPLPEPETGRNKIAIIYGTGQIIRDGGERSGVWQDEYMGAEAIQKAFKKATKDKDVAAIVFRINSPGGSHVASESILHAVRKAQQSGKPVIVSMSDYAASGGYWVATYADKIVAHPSTITGSIGVITGKLVAKDAFSKIGVNWDSVKSGENAGMWALSTDFSPYAWERIQGSLDQIYNAFIERVAEGRKLPKEHVQQIAKGRVWSGEDALKFGLVDKLGDLKEAIELAKEAASLKEAAVPIEVYPKPIGLADELQHLLFNDDTHAESGILAPTLRALIGLNSFYMQIRSYITPGAETTLLNLDKIKG